MSTLMRELAPIPDAAWAILERDAKNALTTYLAGRKLVDFAGPLGWAHDAVGLGRATALEPPTPRVGVEARLRRVQPLTELRAVFALDRGELEATGRGATDANLAPLDEAARAIALAEDRAVFHGYPAASIRGMAEGSHGTGMELSTDYRELPEKVVEAVHRMRTAGVGGPYALALGPRCHDGVYRTFTAAGYPIIDQIARVVDGPIVWAPAVEGAVVCSTRGGDFELTVGQDLSIGYLAHDAQTVTLYIQESFTFRCLGPAAAVALRLAQ